MNKTQQSSSLDRIMTQWRRCTLPIAVGLCFAVVTVACQSAGKTEEKKTPPETAGSPSPSAEVAVGAGGADAAPAAQGAELPAWEYLEFRQMTMFPTCRGNQRLRVEADGRVFLSEETGDCDAEDARFETPYPETPSRTLSADELSGLSTLLADSGVLQLPPESVDPTTEDGSREELEVGLPSGTVIIAVQNTELESFSKVKKHLLRWKY